MTSKDLLRQRSRCDVDELRQAKRRKTHCSLPSHPSQTRTRSLEGPASAPAVLRCYAEPNRHHPGTNRRTRSCHCDLTKTRRSSRRYS
jgi:hypothetical protein